jgi:HlyD family secretion protein
LFVIAQDLRKMRVLADVDEADVGKLKEQMEADAVVDAFPGESFHGIVQQIRFSPNNVQGVVTYSAVIEVDNPEEKLRPGMTATVTIRTRESKGVPRIPNAALRYRPTPPMGPDGKPVPQPPEAALAKGQGRVYLVTSEKPGDEKDEQKLVSIGITDGMFTEITGGALGVGTKVVTDETDQTDDKKKKGRVF